MASLDATELEALTTFLGPVISARIVDAIAEIKSRERHGKQQLEKLRSLMDRLDSIQSRLASLKRRR
jgi:hypothetical protein